VNWRRHRSDCSTSGTREGESRGYQNGDDVWKETDSLNADDMLPMAELLREAYAWIKYQRRLIAARWRSLSAEGRTYRGTASAAGRRGRCGRSKLSRLRSYRD
jgi:hypothetical protein